MLSLPDAIGIAIEEWHKNRVTRVQQDLLAGPTAGNQTPASDMTVSMTHQVPAALRTTGNAGAEMELQFGLAHSAEAYIGTCPDCGSQMEYAEGCVKCHVCGFSECG